MARTTWTVSVSLCCVAFLGCAKEEDYLDVFRDQQAAWHDLTEVLSTVRDEKSMAEAKVKLDASFDKFESLAKRAKALPAPSEKVRMRLEKEREYLEQTTNALKREVGRVQKMPGGMEFLNQYQSRHPALKGTVR